MQYGNQVPQRKPDSLFKGVIYPWFSVSCCYFDVMYTLQEFAASSVSQETHRYLSHKYFKNVF